jgi:nicotinic acid phosphoribosyltransferase
MIMIKSLIESLKEAMLREISMYGSGAFACVMDSYDYSNALNKILPSISKQKLDKGGFMVLRPDSGDPVEAVLMGLK